LFKMQGELLLPLTDFPVFYTCLQMGSYIEGKMVIQIKITNTMTRARCLLLPKNIYIYI
jgi:hypothetical protein